MFRSQSLEIIQLILITFLLAGCTNTEPVQVEKSYPRPPDQALEACPTDLPNAKNPTRKAVLEARAKTARIIVTCEERRQTLENYINDVILKEE